MMLQLAATGCLLSACLAAAGDPTATGSDSSVTAAREVLRAQRGWPWYDADRDALRRITVAPNEEDQRRRSRWATESDKEAVEREAAPVSFFAKLMQILAWTLLGAILVALMWLLVWAARRLDTYRLARGETIQRAAIGPERAEDLPMALPPTDQDLLAAARASYAAGDYNMAIIYAYAHQLVELDSRHAIQLRKGKTNRQYLRELRAWPRLRELLRETIRAFESVFFGQHTLSRLQFERCWERLDEFHHHLEQLA